MTEQDCIFYWFVSNYMYHVGEAMKYFPMLQGAFWVNKTLIYTLIYSSKELLTHGTKWEALGAQALDQFGVQLVNASVSCQKLLIYFRKFKSLSSVETFIVV